MSGEPGEVPRKRGRWPLGDQIRWRHRRAVGLSSTESDGQMCLGLASTGCCHRSRGTGERAPRSQGGEPTRERPAVCPQAGDFLSPESSSDSLGRESGEPSVQHCPFAQSSFWVPTLESAPSVQGKGREGAVRSPVNPLPLSSRVSAQVSLEKPPPFVPHVHQVTGGRPQRGRGLLTVLFQKTDVCHAVTPAVGVGCTHR